MPEKKTPYSPIALISINGGRGRGGVEGSVRPAIPINLMHISYGRCLFYLCTGVPAGLR